MFLSASQGVIRRSCYGMTHEEDSMVREFSYPPKNNANTRIICYRFQEIQRKTVVLVTFHGEDTGNAHRVPFALSRNRATRRKKDNALRFSDDKLIQFLPIEAIIALHHYLSGWTTRKEKWMQPDGWLYRRAYLRSRMALPLCRMKGPRMWLNFSKYLYRHETENAWRHQSISGRMIRLFLTRGWRRLGGIILHGETHFGGYVVIMTEGGWFSLWKK